MGLHPLTLAEDGPAGIKDAAGNKLTGNTSQSLHLLWGDFNDDGVVNAVDLSGVNNARLGGGYVFGATPSGFDIFADLNGDGLTDTADVQIVRTQIGNTLP